MRMFQKYKPTMSAFTDTYAHMYHVAVLIIKRNAKVDGRTIWKFNDSMISYGRILIGLVN